MAPEKPDESATVPSVIKLALSMVTLGATILAVGKIYVDVMTAWALDEAKHHADFERKGSFSRLDFDREMRSRDDKVDEIHALQRDVRENRLRECNEDLARTNARLDEHLRTHRYQNYTQRGDNDDEMGDF